MSSVGYAVAAESQVLQRPSQPQKKKLGFFKRWLLKNITEVVASERNLSSDSRDMDIISSKSLRVGRQDATIDQPERAVHFTVYAANGGRVIETKRYDRKTDRHANNLYVVTSDQDFGREIDKIITMESLRV